MDWDSSDSAWASSELDWMALKFFQRLTDTRMQSRKGQCVRGGGHGGELSSAGLVSRSPSAAEETLKDAAAIEPLNAEVVELRSQLETR